MKVVLRNDEYTIYQRRDGRYAVEGADKKAINGDEKVAILVANDLIKAALPAAPEPEPVEEVAEEAAAEAPAEEAAEAPAEEAAEAAVEETPAEEAPAEEAPAEEAEAPAEDAGDAKD
jgi:hypothetical protein